MPCHAQTELCGPCINQIVVSVVIIEVITSVMETLVHFTPSAHITATSF